MGRSEQDAHRQLTRILGSSQDVGVLIALDSLIALRGLESDLQAGQGLRVEAGPGLLPSGPGQCLDSSEWQVTKWKFTKNREVYDVVAAASRIRVVPCRPAPAGCWQLGPACRETS